MQKPIVFISSTFKDLEHYRTEVDKTIRVLDSESISMEHFGSDHRKPLEVCLRAIDDCKIFVGIYALRYGFIPPIETSSITELEYHHAVKQGKTILAFVAKDAIQFEDKYVSEGISTDPDDIKKLQAFKTQIGLGRVIREFVTMDELGKYMAIELGKYYIKMIQGKALSNPIAHLSLPKGIFYPVGSPYVGLRYFSRQEAKVFYGRNQLIFDLYNALQKDEPIVLVYGQTGVGKSSVLEAGLLPRLEAQGWDVKTLRRQKEQGLSLQWQDAMQNWNAPKRLLVIDQAEELWTLPNPDLATEKQDFFAALRLLRDSYDPHYKLILSFRKEFLAEMETGLREQNLPHLKVLVKPMNQPELMEAITQVQEDKDAYDRYHISIHEDLPHEMAYDLRRDDQSHLAPLLQATLSRMWALARTETPDDILTFDQDLYDRVKTESLESFLHEQIHQIAQQQPEAVQSGLVLDLLHYLTTEMGTAAQCNISDLQARYPHAGQLEALLAACENAYLLLKPTPQTLRLSHDALAPLVQKAYRLSEAPGPKAARILEAKDLNQRTEEHFTEAEITTLQAGQGGMRQLSEAEQKAIAQTQTQIAHRQQQAEAQRQATLRALSNGLVKDVKSAAEQKEYSKAIRLAEKAWEVDNNNPKSLESLRNSHTSFPSLIEFQGHFGWINSGVLSCDNQYVLTVSDDGIARLWDFAGKCIATLDGHKSRVTSAVFSANSQYILTASWDNTACLWDINGQLITVLNQHIRAVNIASFSFDEQRILTASSDGTARIWDIKGQLISILEGHRGNVTSAIFSHDSRFVLTTSEHNIARLWDKNGQWIVDLKGHLSKISHIKFSPDSQIIVTTSPYQARHLTYIWNLQGQLIDKIKYHCRVTFFLFTPDSQNFYVFYEDGHVHLWDINGQQKNILSDVNIKIKSAIFCPDECHILAISVDNVILIWNLQSNKIIEFKNHQGRVLAVSFSLHDFYILTTNENNIIFLWDNNIKKKFYQENVISAIFSPDNENILAISHDGVAQLWNKTGIVSLVFDEQVDCDLLPVFSFDGQSILTVSPNGIIRVWDIRGRLLGILPERVYKPKALFFYPDGQFILTVDRFESACLWDVEGKFVKRIGNDKVRIKYAELSSNGQYILIISNNELVSLLDRVGLPKWDLPQNANHIIYSIFSPNSQYILTTTSDRIVCVWDINCQRLVSKFLLDINFNNSYKTGKLFITFSPDSSKILAVKYGDKVSVWDITGKRLAILYGHRNAITSAIFSPNSQYILTASYDNTSCLWDISGNKIAVLEGHTDTVRSAAFSPDGQRILTSSSDNTIRLWELNPQAIIEDINKRPISVLSWEELKEYDIDNIEKAAGIDREEELLVTAPHEMRLYHYARYYYDIACTDSSLQEEYAQKSLRLYNKLIAFMPLQFYQQERQKVLELQENIT